MDKSIKISKVLSMISLLLLCVAAFCMMILLYVGVSFWSHASLGFICILGSWLSTPSLILAAVAKYKDSTNKLGRNLYLVNWIYLSISIICGFKIISMIVIP